MPVWVAVALGGAAGSLARWQLGIWLRAAGGFPYATLLVNVSGSFLIGLLAAYCAKQTPAEWLRLGLMTGVLGGFTTFSAFSLETLLLAKTQPTTALLNVALNLGLSLAACALGFAAYTARP